MEAGWVRACSPGRLHGSGYASGRVNTLRLWTAKSYDEFDLLTFNKSEYLDAVKPQVEAENISKILYPEDSTPQQGVAPRAAVLLRVRLHP